MLQCMDLLGHPVAGDRDVASIQMCPMSARKGVTEQKHKTVGVFYMEGKTLQHKRAFGPLGWALAGNRQ